MSSGGNEQSLRTGDPNAEDVNDDALLDLACYFDSQATSFYSNDTQGVLRGETMGGVMIRGTDSVRVIR